LESEQKRWRDFDILPEAKEEEYTIFKNGDGTKIAEIWLEKADNFCNGKRQQIQKYVDKYKVCHTNWIY